MTDVTTTRGTGWRRAGSFAPALLYAVAMFLIGFLYRLTWIFQGWAATDEGWLQAQGQRIASGQVPYRDFDYVFPPLTSFKEAALFAVLGNSWTVYASRMLFTVEVSIAPVLAFLILRRFVSDRAAFIATVPAIFFTVIVLAFTSYTIDAEFMALASLTFAVYGGSGSRFPKAMGIASGICAVLAFMAKQPFLAFLPAIPFVALASTLLRRGDDRPVEPPVHALQTVWRWYLVGCVVAGGVIVAYFASAGALGDFTYQAILLTTQAHPTSLRFKLIQDLPEYITRYDALVPAVVAVIVILFAFRIARAYELARSALLAVVFGFALALTLRHPPPPSRPLFVIVAYGVLVAVGLVALAATGAVYGPWFRNNSTARELRDRLFPPELVFVALLLQWMAQFHYDGLVFWYEGAYLSVPVVLLFLHRMSSVSLPLVKARTISISLGTPVAASVLLGAYLVAGGAGVVIERPYQDAPRSQLTADFTTPALQGIKGYPLTVQRFEGLVAQVDQRTKPGDPIYVIPDFSILYAATHRRNPVRMDWPNESFLTQDFIDKMVSRLHSDPPKLVFVLNQREGAYQRDQTPIDWPNTRWAPVYGYLMAHYTQVDSVQDIKVMVPNGT